MPNSILSYLTDLRARYARQLQHIEASDMDPLFRRIRMKELRAGIEECDRQIANEIEEEDARQPLECDIEASKRYQDCHEQ